MTKPTLRARLSYAFDNSLSRGPVALIGWLGAASAAVVVGVSLLVWASGMAPEYGLGELLWMSLMRTLDPGTMGGDVGAWPFLLSMFGVTMGGIFVISMLIGVLTTGLEERLQDLRKGRSCVVESGHTVILGWSEQVYSVVAQLALANANQRRACVVVLADKDKIEMEDALRDKVASTGRTRVVCRRGSPMDMGDLEITNLHEARSIIVLAPDDDDGDSSVIKTMLAITNHPGRRATPYHIVSEIRDPRNMDVARLVGGDEAELVLIGDLIARIIAQTCRQSGLSAVYNELFDFTGNEIYAQAVPELAGKTFAEALPMLEGSTILGIHPKGGAPHLNPPMETPIGPSDRLIVLAEDDDAITLFSGPPAVDEAAIHCHAPAEAGPERTLILGWNWRAPAVITEMDRYVAPGSDVTVVADLEGPSEEIARLEERLCRQRLVFRCGDTTDPDVLNALGVETYHHIIILCYGDTLDPQQADARTLVTLLHLRDIGERCGHPFSIVTEMQDMRNRELAEVARADDYIVSDRLVSLVLAQISENKALNAIFCDLLDPEGSEIYLKPAGDYVELAKPVTFATVVASASRRGEVAMGYRLGSLAGDAAQHYGVALNPPKAEGVTFSEGDRVIVLAES